MKLLILLGMFMLVAPAMAGPFSSPYYYCERYAAPDVCLRCCNHYGYSESRVKSNDLCYCKKYNGNKTKGPFSSVGKPYDPFD